MKRTEKAQPEECFILYVDDKPVRFVTFMGIKHRGVYWALNQANGIVTTMTNDGMDPNRIKVVKYTPEGR